MKITRCQGNGQGSCKRCEQEGRWNRVWTTMLHEIEGYEFVYCSDCVKKIKEEQLRKMNIGETTVEFLKDIVEVTNISRCKYHPGVEFVSFKFNGIRLFIAIDIDQREIMFLNSEHVLIRSISIASSFSYDELYMHLGFNLGILFSNLININKGGY